MSVRWIKEQYVQLQWSLVCWITDAASVGFLAQKPKSHFSKVLENTMKHAYPQWDGLKGQYCINNLVFILHIYCMDTCHPMKPVQYTNRVCCLNHHWKQYNYFTRWQHHGKIKRRDDSPLLESIKWSSSGSWLAQLSFITCHIPLVFVLAALSDTPQPRNTDWNHFSLQLEIGHIIKVLQCFFANIGCLT